MHADPETPSAARPTALATCSDSSPTQWQSQQRFETEIEICNQPAGPTASRNLTGSRIFGGHRTYQAGSMNNEFKRPVFNGNQTFIASGRSEILEWISVISYTDHHGRISGSRLHGTNTCPETTICIDALDEVESKVRLQLLKSLKHVMEKTKNRVKIFATTRMDTDILPDDNAADINRFIQTIIEAAIKDKRLLDSDISDEVKGEICDALRERSKGMFRLGALQITVLCDMSTKNEVRRSLGSLPKILANAYAEMYERILGQQGSAPQLTLRAFRWIQCSYELKRTETLLDAIMVDVGGSGEFAHDGTNFLIMDERSNVFRFAHLSADEYLETQLLKVDSHTEIAKSALESLRSAHETGTGRFFCLFGLRRIFIGVFQPKSKRNRVRMNRLLLHACTFGDLDIVQLLLDGEADVPAANCWIRTPLHEASSEGHGAVVRLLIGRRADVSAVDTDGHTPLHLAVMLENEVVARLLIDREAEVPAANTDV
ncbi:hypothetical protein BZA05DRAFT_439415 [Tricharina praecox]|uniref:uncharacterized protein n=1 Tax=Tricharina praecox TaxID=43433 RepID=UPI00221F8BF2|nr:uncharacterized protein BZA05DRAFT_439415 [Tricharina praecox]KAI5842745.1 hypothetical protein BZA05DRAFT_439415 [Tricharina praecox]